MDPDRFREAMSRWASGVTIVACRHDGRTIATTVSAFLSLSLEPPLVLIAIGPNATVLPFLQPDHRFGISILAEAQRRIATVHADPFPVGPHPFSPDDPPLVEDALVRFDCTVSEQHVVGGHTIVVARVADATFRDGQPLIRYARRYHGLADD